MTLTIDDTLSSLAVDAQLDRSPRFAPLASGARRALFALADARRQSRTVSMTDLANQIGLSKAALTSVMDRLEDERLAKRVADPSDRRRIIVRITDAGFSALVEALAGEAVAA